MNESVTTRLQEGEWWGGGGGWGAAPWGPGGAGDGPSSVITQAQVHFFGLRSDRRQQLGSALLRQAAACWPTAARWF